MTLTRLDIHNYQSIYDASVVFGPLTVLVGPSSSGKSAVLRALRHACRNTRGSSFITHGAKSSRVTLTLPQGSVTLERSGSSGTYTVTPVDGEPQEFTRLGGAAPAEVTEFIGISDDSFAGQFDGPYLLTAPGSEVARTLGELTGVTKLLSAAREGARRKLSQVSVLKAVRTELESTQAALDALGDVEALLESQEALEQILGQAEDTDSRSVELQALVEQLRQPAAEYADLPVPAPSQVDELEQALATIRSVEHLVSGLLQLPQVPESLEVPDPSELYAIDSDLILLQTLVSNVRTVSDIQATDLPIPEDKCLGMVAQLDTLISSLSSLVRELSQPIQPLQVLDTASLSQDYDRLLLSMGTCPTCGKDVS